jgi:hypothetical protein
MPKTDGVPGHLVVEGDEATKVRSLFTCLVDEQMTSRLIAKRLSTGPRRPCSMKTRRGKQRAPLRSPISRTSWSGRRRIPPIGY